MTAPLTLREAVLAAWSECSGTDKNGVNWLFVEDFAAELDRLGYVVMPKEPTEAMIEKIREWFMDPKDGVLSDGYRAAIAARPRVGGDDDR